MTRCLYANPSVHGGNVDEIRSLWRLDGQEIVDFSSSINPLGPPRSVVEVLRRDLLKVSQYPSRDHSKLKRAVAGYAGVDEECVVLGSGAVQLIYLIISYLRPGRVLTCQPTFSEYARAAAVFGASVVNQCAGAGQGFRHDMELLGKKAANVDLLMVANPNNPTGRLLSASELRDLAGSTEALVVIDEAFIEFSGDQSLINYAAKSRNLVVIRSLTKFFALPGLRLGFLVARPDTAKKLESVLPPWNIGVLAESAGLAALADGDFIRNSLATVPRLRTDLVQQLRRLKQIVVYPSAANFLLLKLGGEARSCQLTKSLAQRGILIRDCCSFPGLGSDFARIAVRKPEENRLLVDTVDTLLSCC